MAEDEDKEALEALEKEASEFAKVWHHPRPSHSITETDTRPPQDAEIDRIRKAFPLDA